jgi:hypothetical protein
VLEERSTGASLFRREISAGPVRRSYQLWRKMIRSSPRLLSELKILPYRYRHVRNAEPLCILVGIEQSWHAYRLPVIFLPLSDRVFSQRLANPLPTPQSSSHMCDTMPHNALGFIGNCTNEGPDKAPSQASNRGFQRALDRHLFGLRMTSTFS